MATIYLIVRDAIASCDPRNMCQSGKTEYHRKIHTFKLIQDQPGLPPIAIDIAHKHWGDRQIPDGFYKAFFELFDETYLEVSSNPMIQVKGEIEEELNRIACQAVLIKYRTNKSQWD